MSAATGPRLRPPSAGTAPPPPPAAGEARAAASTLLLDACRRVGAAEGIVFRPPVRAPGEVAEVSLEAICSASRVRFRSVTLRGRWWRRDHGPLLGFLGEGSAHPGRPVALLPLGRGRYALEDPASGRRARVGGAVAAELDPGAFVFHPPLPRRPLRPADLARAGYRAARGEVRTLAVAALLGGALGLAAPLATARLVGSAIPAGDGRELLHLFLALLACAVAAGLVHLARALAVLRIEARVDRGVQGGVWDHLLSLPASFFRGFAVADLHARAMGIEAVRTLVSGHVLSAVLSLVLALSSFAVLFHYAPPLAGLATLLLVALALATAAIARLQLRELRRVQERRARVASLLFDLLGGIHKLRVAGAERRARDEWARAYAAERRAEARAQRLAVLQGSVNAVYALLAPLVLFAAVGLTGGAGMELAAFLAFNVAFGQLQGAVFGVLGVAGQLLAVVPHWERLQPILAAAPEAEGGRVDPGPLRGELELRDVTFRYAPGAPAALEGVSLRAGPGELVALVGATGSGKSTCLRLLLGFERPDSGEVLVDGRPLETLDIPSVRRQLGVVLQDGQPLVGTILANIAGSRDLEPEEAWAAARAVGLEEEIRGFPMGMYTFVNDRGTTLSGGQRQRILLARAIVGRPRVLLLDEATSALDVRTQETVVRTLASLGATRVVIAHRLSTVRDADRIYVLDAGRVVESGTYDELMALGGTFARMAARQVA
jgi:NHLM bacteriocin system ABC transporter ATP-binding protein